MVDVILQFSARDDAGSTAIKLFERGWCSHVDTVFPDGSLLGARSDEVGGKPAGVQLRPANYMQFDKTVRYTLRMPTYNAVAFADFLQKQIGKPYDEKAIVAFALGRDWHNPDAWFCSELVAAALEQSGWFPNKISEDANFLTPRDLEIIISPWSALRVSSPN